MERFEKSYPPQCLETHQLFSGFRGFPHNAYFHSRRFLHITKHWIFRVWITTEEKTFFRFRSNRNIKKRTSEAINWFHWNFECKYLMLLYFFSLRSFVFRACRYHRCRLFAYTVFFLLFKLFRLGKFDLHSSLFSLSHARASGRKI